MQKMSELRIAGVNVRCLIEPDSERISVFVAGTRMQLSTKETELMIPEVFPEFRVPVSTFFEL